MRSNALSPTVVALGVVVGLGMNVMAEPPQNPYRVILSHNAFHLRPIVKPEPAKPPEPPPVAPARIFLTGIVTLSGPKAFLQVEDPHTKKVEFLPPLAVGERYKTIAVLAIDPLNQTVRIRNENGEDTLDFLNDGVKPKAVAAVPPTPVPPRPRTVPAPPPPFVSPAATPPPRGAVITGGSVRDVQPNYLNGVQRTGAAITREQVEARLALEREIRQRENDSTHKLVPAIH